MNGPHVTRVTCHAGHMSRWLDALFVEFEFFVRDVFIGHGYEPLIARAERVLVISAVAVELLGVGVV